MTRLLLFLLERATPRADREWVVGDTLEELARLERTAGAAAARRWLRGEVWRVLFGAAGHRFAARTARESAPRAARDGWAAALIRDARHGLRLLRRSPGYTAVAVATLGLGIGANTAMFAVLNAVLLKPLPFTDVDRLMLVHLTRPNAEDPRGVSDVVWSFPKYQTFLATQQVFDDTALFAGRDLTLSGGLEPLRVRGELITERYPAVLGLTPALGRTLTHDEAVKPGTAPVALISHGLWTRRFEASSSVLGRTIQVDAQPHTIVGVLPRGFRGLGGNADVWLPVAFEPGQLAPNAAWAHSYRLVARRKPAIAEAAAIAAVKVAGSHVDAAHKDPEVGDAWGATAVSLHASRADADVRRGTVVLLYAVGCVLLIACLNLTNLAGARALARGREVAVRLAIGASRLRIVRQFFVEGVLIAAAGSAAGLLAAWGFLQAATVLLPEANVFFGSAIAPSSPRTAGAAGLTRIGASMIGLDAATLSFTLAIGGATAVLVSLMPALRVSALRPVEVLKAAGRAATERGLHALGARAFLVTGQIALALVLLTGAGLMLRSAAGLYSTGIGVVADHLMTVRLDLPRSRYQSEAATTFFGALLERVRSTAGVESVGLVSCPPVSGGCNSTSVWNPQTGRRGGGRDPLVGVNWISPDALPTLGVRLIGGRLFDDRDRDGQPKVVLVNETAARRFWPNESALGKRIAVGQGGLQASPGAEIVGVVSDVRYAAIETAATPDVYVPLAQSVRQTVRMFVRTRTNPDSMAAAIRREIQALDPALALSEVKTMGQRVDDAMWRTRVGAWLLASFAGLALLLTSIGIFGLMAQSVAQRTGEIGIRMALGAARRDVLSLVLRRAALVTIAGLAAGTAGAFGVTRLIATLLYGVEATDPMTFASVALLLGLVAIVACYIPAYRATRVDAIAALRAE